MTKLASRLLLCLLGNCGLLHAGNGIEQVRFQHLGVAAGLSQSSARVMVQDATGFVWIGTQDGLNRYDGYDFKVFRHDPTDPTSVPDNHIMALAADGRGGLWVGTQAGGLAHFDPVSERFRRVATADGSAGGLAAHPVSALLLAGDGRLWIAVGAGIVHQLDRNDDRLQTVEATRTTPLGSVRRLRAAADGRVLVASTQGLWVMGPDSTIARVHDDPVLRTDMHEVVVGAAGEIWLGSESHGLLRLAADGQPDLRLSQSDGLAANAVRAVLLDRADRVWVATLNGLSRYLPATGRLQTWRHDPVLRDGIAASRLHSLLEDRDGLIWVGSWFSGVNFFDPRSEAFTSLRPASGDPHAVPGLVFPAVLPAADGKLWLGVHDSGGVVEFDLQRGVQRRFRNDPEDPDSLGNNVVRSLAWHPDGRLWVALGVAGVDLLDPATGRAEHFRHDPADPHSLPIGEAYDLIVDRSGTLWLSVIDVGLVSRCRDCTGFTVFRPDPQDPHSLGGTDINHLYESASGELWLALRHAGLGLLDAQRQRFTTYAAQPDRPDGLANASVTFVGEDATGTLWVGTQGGGLHRLLSRTPQPRFQRWSRRDGLAADAIGAALLGRDGFIWLSTTLGLSRLDPATGVIRNFSGNEGAQASGYFIGAAAALSDGRLVFGGLQGVTVFDPLGIAPLAPIHAVAISQWRISDLANSGQDQAQPWQVIDGRPMLSLPAAADDFQFDLSALSFSRSDNLSYEYRLDGYDRDWLSTDSRRRFAAYTNVPHGQYRFLARARSSSGEVGTTLEVPVTIAARPWATPMAKTGYAALATVTLLFVAGLVRARVRERARASASLQASEQRLKLALWGTGDELWDLDMGSGALRRDNPMPHLRASGEEYVADVSSLRVFLHPDDMEEFDRAVVAHLRGDTDVLDVVYRAQDIHDDWLWLRTRGRVIERDQRGRALRLTGTTADITELKRQEEALERLNENLERRVDARTRELTVTNESLQQTVAQLRDAQAQLVESEKVAALGGLVAGVAHEINTPIGIGVTAASHLNDEISRALNRHRQQSLAGTELDELLHMARDATALVLRNLERADRQIRSFKQLAVDQSSEAQRRIVVADYLGEILASLRPVLRGTRHRIEVECDPSVVVLTYPGALYQIVSNLVVNSLIYAFDADTSGLMRIVVQLSGDSLSLVYSDNGCGMEEAVRRRIFEPFFTTRRGQGGSGLGMHIVHNLVTQVLKGSVQCESAPGEGVVFTLVLPIAEAAAQA